MVENVTYFLPVGSLVDKTHEIKRLNKEMAKIEREIIGLEKKLSNTNFTSKAPSEVVEENQKRLLNYKASFDKLSEALQRIESL